MNIIENVSTSYLSVARYSGGAVINGVEYIYENSTDRLILKSYYNKNIQSQKKVKIEDRQIKINL
jgi:hypothetical protein